jgi:hypothetical protein
MALVVAVREDVAPCRGQGVASAVLVVGDALPEPGGVGHGDQSPFAVVLQGGAPALRIDHGHDAAGAVAHGVGEAEATGDGAGVRDAGTVAAAVTVAAGLPPTLVDAGTEGAPPGGTGFADPPGVAAGIGVAGVEGDVAGDGERTAVAAGAAGLGVATGSPVDGGRRGRRYPSDGGRGAGPASRRPNAPRKSANGQRSWRRQFTELTA